MKKINLNNPVPEGVHLDYRDNNMTLLNNVHQIQIARERIMNDFYIVLVVQQGTCTAIVNNNEISLVKNDLLICAPGNILERGVVSIDFLCNIFLISPQFGNNITKGTNMSMEQYLLKKVTEIVHLTPDENKIILGYYNLISSHNTMPDTYSKSDIVLRLMQSFAYTFAHIFATRGIGQQKKKYNSAEYIFRNFVQTLKEYPHGRTVNFYATKLNITPKYFNSVCKQISGKTASKLINEELANLAQTMFTDPDLSIKQIATTLGFINQSHFGTFIRRELGASPQTIRKQLLLK
jgi:AraC-like DNA-binding protein